MAEESMMLETSSYLIGITTHCGEGTVTCDNVSYRVTEKRAKRTTSHRGHTEPSKCRDGEPCRLRGYVFHCGGSTFYVTRDAALVISKGAKLLSREEGEWK